MTTKQAIRILMEAAARDSRGTGCGIRSQTHEQREEISQTWTKCFPMIHGRKPSDADYFNAGINRPMDSKQ